MARGFGASKGKWGAGAVHDPLDSNQVERELGLRRKMEVPPPFVGMGWQSATTIMGFIWVYLARNFDRFAPTTFEDGRKGWSDFHTDFIHLLCSDAERVAVAAPREHAKSTIGTSGYGLAHLLFRSTDYILLVSDTFEGQAVEHIRDYHRELTENEDLIKQFGIKKLVKAVEGDIIVKFEDGCLARVKAIGMEGAVRGLKWRGKRPGLILMDDVENPELVESKLRRDKSRNWIMKDLLPAGRKGCRVRMVGTILHHDAVLSRFCRDDTWVSKIYRAHKSFDDFSDILWPEQWPEERLRKVRQGFINQQNSDGYSQEYLNDPVSPVDAYFREDDLLECDTDQLVSPGEYYVGWDFAVSKDERRDFTARSIWKVDSYRRKIKVDNFTGRLDAKEIVEKMIETEKDYAPRGQFVEKGTIERAIEPFLNDRMRQEECYINLIKITRNKDKESFARPLQGMVRRHDLTFNKKMEGWNTVQDQYLRFPRADHDDIIDSDSIIAQGLREIITAPSQDEIDEEEFFAKFRKDRLDSRSDGRNQTTGY